ncbi:MAG TPA: FAD-binding oxidoreductase, partial [Chitinophagaceae bacterium]|nr:FAD-binding oxidoreductase [Chitinophagaceae bacterium]
MKEQLQRLQARLKGELYFNDSAYHQGQLLAFSTDASVYEEKPVAVAMPMNEEDLVQLVHFATDNRTTLIPRAAGTSLAGQVVGNGIVTDLSRYFNRIIELNAAERWVRVQPGVIRDDLNRYLQPYGLMFGPETSTANRAMIGGMVGNNSCGLHSIVWGAVRDHLLAVRMVLQDGSIAQINTPRAGEPSNSSNIFLNLVQNQLRQLLQDAGARQAIAEHFPGPQVSRRNCGYALDALLETEVTNGNDHSLNLCKLIAGSEGTLGIVTEITLQLLPLPPAFTAVVCIHCNSIKESLLANAVALRTQPMASELVDKCILDYTIDHPLHHANRFFIEGDPAAVLMVEYMHSSKELLDKAVQQLQAALQAEKLGYAYPVLYNKESNAAWEVRKAGLGLLRNSAGDRQPVNLIEDCAVAPQDLPAYIDDLLALLNKYQVQASFYAHAGAGE